MNSARRLSVCYLVPGHDLMSSMGPSRNVLNMARALSQWADVTVAFRRLADAQPPEGIRVLEIQPQAVAATIDDAAMRGLSLTDFLRYMRDLRRFVQRDLAAFDVILEKNWLLSGYLSSLCARRGQLGVPIENIVPNPQHSRQLMKALRLQAGRWIAGRCLREAPLIIAETEFLKREIVRFWKVQPEQVEVVDLGVDRTMFHALDQTMARQRLGLPAGKTMLTYVGVLDLTHDLEHCIRALTQLRPANVELHIVGDGVRRAEYEAMAGAARDMIVFHGRVPHHDVPQYIAASDLCLAPYDSSAFSSGELGYSTMKIPEYLSVGRAVVSVPSGRIRSLIREGETGFLMLNEPERWMNFLSALPSRERLRTMGEAAGAVRLASWDDTAQTYLQLCERFLKTSRRSG